MDWLKLEIDSKKRQLDQDSSTASSTTGDGAPPPKYMRRADLERQRLQERQEEEQREQRDKEERLLALAKKVATKERDSSSSTTKSRTKGKGKESTPLQDPSDTDGTPSPASLDPSSSSVKPEAFNVTNDEAILRLRRKGQPIRLFGESDKERRLRLRALELIEQRSEGGRNDFARALEGMEMGFELEREAKSGGGGGGTAVAKVGKEKKMVSVSAGGEEAGGQDKGKEEGGEDREPNPKDEEVLVDVSLVRSNPHKVYPQIYHALKRVLKEWEQSLLDRPESVRRSTQGKIASATQQTSADYLKPLFKSLRKRDLAPDLLLGLAEITHCMQTREYLQANDAYLRLSIGNAPWPIGVTMVGIHERAGRERIFNNNVAHVLNDETSRKYIQSLKRLLTFAQTVRPPADLSQIMG